MTLDGTVTEFLLPTKNSGLYDITRGPDGNVWFTEDFGRLGRITPAAASSGDGAGGGPGVFPSTQG
jgi:virginiamycin B lyase